MSDPTIIELPTAAAIEAARALFWRKSVLRISRTELSRRLGYSVPAIQLFERGYDYKGRAIGEKSWLRYRLACAGLTVKNFTWTPEET